MTDNLVEIDPLADEGWPEFVCTHPSASAFHTRGWLRALSRTYGYRTGALVRRNGSGKLVAGLPFCHVESWLTGKRIISLPFSDHCEPLVDDPAGFVELSSALIEVARRHGYKHVELRPCSGLDEVPQFGSSSRFHLHRLDLTPGVSGVFRGFHKDSIQRKIRRAERENLRIAAGNNPQLVDEFYHLLLRTRRRHGLPPQPRTWFHNLAEELRDCLLMRIAYKENRAIAGVVTIEHRDKLMYKYGASDERFHNLGGMAAVFWQAIQDGIGGGFQSMDMGRSDLDNPGLTTFKEHWGAARHQLAYWRYPSTPSHHAAPSWRMRMMQRACNYAPDFVLGPVGSFLYRHVG